jgi:hypothetical protein
MNINELNDLCQKLFKTSYKYLIDECKAGLLEKFIKQILKGDISTLSLTENSCVSYTITVTKVVKKIVTCRDCVRLEGQHLSPNCCGKFFMSVTSTPVDQEVKVEQEGTGEQVAQGAIVECDLCDGCGWYEGGITLKTTCGRCKGTGVVQNN